MLFQIIAISSSLFFIFQIIGCLISFCKDGQLSSNWKVDANEVVKLRKVIGDNGSLLTAISILIVSLVAVTYLSDLSGRVYPNYAVAFFVQGIVVNFLYAAAILQLWNNSSSVLRTNDAAL